MFGHASMLSGLPTGFEARAARPTTCLRIGAALAQEVLAAPEGLRYVTRSLLEEPTDLHVLAREAGSNVADEPVGDPAPRSRRRVRSGHAAARGGAADERGIGQRDRGDRWTAVDARDRHRPGPAYARGRRRAVGRRAGVAGDVDAGPHLRRRAAGGRGAAGDARPRAAPSAGAVAARRAARRDRGHRPGGRADAVLVLPAPADRGRRQRHGAGRGGPRAAADGRLAARGPCGGGQRDGCLRRVRGRAHPPAAGARRRPVRTASAPSSRGWRWAARLGARRCPAPTWTRRSCGSAQSTTRPRCASGWSALGREVLDGLQRVRAAAGRARRQCVVADVRALAGVLAARGPQLDRGSDAGEGAGPVRGADRQPSGVGRAHRDAGGRHVRAGARPSGTAAPPGALRRSRTVRRPGFCAGSWSSTPASTGAGWISSTAASLPIVALARWAAMSAGVTIASTPERLRAASRRGHALGRRRPQPERRV